MRKAKGKEHERGAGGRRGVRREWELTHSPVPPHRSTGQLRSDFVITSVTRAKSCSHESRHCSILSSHHDFMLWLLLLLLLSKEHKRKPRHRGLSDVSRWPDRKCCRERFGPCNAPPVPCLQVCSVLPWVPPTTLDTENIVVLFQRERKSEKQKLGDPALSA